MILLLSQDSFEISTEEVQDWIEALGHACVRLNGEDLNGDAPFSFAYEGGADVEFELEGVPVRGADAGAVWWRRWHAYDNLGFLDAAADPALRAQARTYLALELRAAGDGLFDALHARPWLTRPGETDVNKLSVLRRASEAGLRVPPTLVTNDRGRLQAFRDRHGRIITKSLWNGRTFMAGRQSWALMTFELTQEDIDAAPARFFPSLVQARVEKELEVRAFYLDGEVYAMAIFSQLDPQTELDFRRYNFQRPNRMVPYRLPGKVEDGIRRLMDAIPLQTGSVDLVRTPEGDHVFLEVNPVGQFQMVSQPCNYGLEKKVAQHLVARAES